MTNNSQTGYAAVNSLRLYYEIHGSGQPLVLLHGAFGSTDMFSDIVPQLAQDRQVIVVDQQGHGRTTDSDRPLWYESLGDVETHIYTVSSRDGTHIAFDQVGNGPPLILVGGAFQHRALDSETARLSELLAPHFTVYHYDRRGRGESGDTQPYAVEREIDDIAALINAVGGAAFVYGMSSGAVLALHAAAQLGPARITRLVLYEPPFNTDADADKQEFAAYKAQIDVLLQENRRGDAVAFFLSNWMPPDMLTAIRQSPEWPLMEAVAPTLA